LLTFRRRPEGLQGYWFTVNLPEPASKAESIRSALG